MIRNVVLVLIAVALLLSTGCGSVQTERGPAGGDIKAGYSKYKYKFKEKDRISIKSVNPKNGLAPNVITEFTVLVEYELISCEKGELNIGFNNGDDITYCILTDRATIIVKKGWGRHTFKVSAKTKDWLGEGDFNVYINLSEYPHGVNWTPLDYDTKALKFRGF